MENNLFIALNQNLITVTLSILTIYIILKISKRYLFDMFQLSNDNISYSIILSGIILSSVNLVSGLSTPVLNTYSFLKMTNESFWNLYLELIKYVGIFAIITFISSIVIILLSYFLINRFFKDLSIEIEIKNNNIALGIILAIITISFSLMLKENFVLLIESFIPYPINSILH